MKKTFLEIGSIILAIMIIFTGCSSANLNSEGYVNNNLPINSTEVSVSHTTTTQTTTDLTNIEKDGILYMVEEEKLAHDVYSYLYDLWGLTIFKNIQSSEQTHMNEVLGLIEKYGLVAPSTLYKQGVFTDPHLQQLYNDLTTQGSKSIVDALKVGALIEETDIIDLKSYINNTDKNDIKTVYTNLMNGSKNHLRAFVSQLSSNGVKYAPVLLSVEEYNAIVGTSNGSSNGKGNFGKSGGH